MTAVTSPASGRLLLSRPLLEDRFFSRAVVLLAEHGDDGTFGIIINKSTGMKLNQISEDFFGFEAEVFIGGPLNMDTIFFIHTRGPEIEGSLEIRDGLYWGGNPQQIKELMATNAITKDEIRFFVGYAGWQPNQLDDEMEQKSWLVVDLPVKGFFYDPPKDLWKNILKTLGSNYSLWINFPTNPEFN